MLVTVAFFLFSVPAICADKSAGHPDTYCNSDTFIGRDFLDKWQWELIPDPTHGRVNYTDKETAIAKNLSVASNTTFVMRADSENMVPPGSGGRNSVRISSNSAWGESVLILDILHMPEGCGTWPAWWSLSKAGPWPHGGEIDIIEGVNTNGDNLSSLHTTSNCTMPENRTQTGQTISTICDAAYNYNQGCGVSLRKPHSYGRDFNRNGGGYYAMRRGPRGIDVWFWTRNDPNVPPEVSLQLVMVNPDSWGVPDAAFPATNDCDYASHFDDHSMIFDLTFCGDWAGSAYAASGCPSTCEEFVNNNPTAFADAYWELLKLGVYTRSDCAQ